VTARAVRFTVTQATTRYRSLLVLTPTERELIVLLRRWPRRYTRVMRDFVRSKERQQPNPA
jgi:hypothetical protein